MDAAIERIAMVQGAPGAEIQDLFSALAGRWAPTLRVAGVVAESHGLADRTCSAGYLRRISGGQRFSIFEDLGPDSTECHLDEDGAGSAAEAVRRDIAAGCDVVVLSKFGKLEAAGKGLWGAFTSAAEAGVPILTSVSPSVRAAWENFAGTGVVALPADGGAIDRWLKSVRAHTELG
ncbi:MAG TPA: DUF2478 domain-containing protein [Rhodopila sp.]|jgi:hypothetical protein|nr:DUF2478 domain-containing protein [Rhodopila sp.]